MASLALVCGNGTFSSLSVCCTKPSSSSAPRGACLPIISARLLRPVEERYRIFTERHITPERAQELGISRWRRWETGKTHYSWQWQVDEQVYIAKGSLQVTPLNCKDSAWFYAGDLVRFPKWFRGTLQFEGDYEERYRFCAYGDD